MKATKKSHSKPKEKTTKSIKENNKNDRMPHDDISKILLTELTKMEIKTITTKHIQTKSTKKELKNRLNQLPDDKTNIDHIYLRKENKKIILIYGAEIYQTVKRLESNRNCIPFDFLIKHQISSQTRTKLIDWFIEVFYVFQLETQAFFLAVDILDQCLFKYSSCLRDQDIHLLGINVLYIASKMEDTIPLRMHNIKHQIGHNKFTQNQIKQNELAILKLISFDIIRISQYDFIHTYIYDFILNNETQCHKLQIALHMKAYENICIFLAKMITMNEEFTSFNPSLKAICCIIAGYDILKSNSSTFTKEMSNLLYQWILLLINESDENAEMISTVYKKLIDFYSNFYKQTKGSNLNKTHDLYFY